ncbi:MAG: AsmA family protein [Alphaproteobacteria bacterium]|nr:AsmA family protein [Alphaproteobacteria bacterium]
MKKIAIGLAAVIVLIIGAAVAIPFFVPLETYKAKLAEQVKAATGRELRLEGPVRFALFPNVELEAEKVVFANAAGAATKDMASLAKLQVQLKLMPLLSGEVAVDRFVLVDPVINLEVDKQGRPNWQFDQAKAPEPAKTSGAGAPPVQQIRLGDIRLVNGRVSYIDQRSGQKQELSAINMALKLPSLDDPLAADGSITWRGKAIDLKLDVAKPRELMAGKMSAVAAKVVSEPVNFDYKGNVTNAQPARIDGDIDLNVPSIRKLAEWTGNVLPPIGVGPNLGLLSIKGKLALAGPKVEFTQAAIAIDAIKSKGAFMADTSGAKPYARAQLDIEKLDLNPYLPPEAPPGQPAAAQGQAKPAAGWSDDPIDLTGLRAANADLALSVGAIQVRKIQVGKSAVKVALKDGKLNLDLTELALYQGSGTGRVALDGAGAVPALESTFQLAKIQVEPLLKDAAAFERLSGAGSFDLAVTGRGKSQRELVGALNGKGAINFADGAIKGINIGEMVRNVTTAFTGGAAGAQKTDFSELSGTYTIASGILKNTDLQMKAPLFRIEGAGTVDLPKRTVDYRVTPKAVATTQGQGGAANLGGISVPVIVQGPWDNISYKPDLASLIKIDPSKALDAVKGLVPGLGGQAPAAGQAPAGGSTAPTLGGAIRGLLPGAKTN